MIAVDWGWSIGATATRLMEESSKARENGQAYAIETARNAAAGIAGGGKGPLFRTAGDRSGKCSLAMRCGRKTLTG